MTAPHEYHGAAADARDNAIGLAFMAVMLLLAVLALGSAPLWI